MRAEEVWFSNRPAPRTVRALLTPLSWLYGLGWQAYLGLYRSGIKRAKEPHRPVLCIGNLTVGGSGKSPLTIHLYDLISAMGKEVVVSCSGYGSAGQHGAAIAPDGGLVTSLWGDEAAMLRLLRPEMPLIVGRNRVRAAELCHREWPHAVLLLDDGFQHLPLKAHFSIVLDEERPRNSLCLPAGPYREPRGNRMRADLVIPGRFKIVEAAGGLTDPQGNPEKAGEIQVLCALGRPDRFVESLNSQSLRIVWKKCFPDHDPLQAGTLWDGFDPEMPIVVTAKDWVKLRQRSDLGGKRLLIARHEVRVEPAVEFLQLLYATLSDAS